MSVTSKDTQLFYTCVVDHCKDDGGCVDAIAKYGCSNGWVEKLQKCMQPMKQN